MMLKLAVAVAVAGNAWQLDLAQVTGEGPPELVYVCYDGAVCAQDQASGEVLWRYETGAFAYDLATGDLDGDGRAETLVASADGSLYAIGPDGKLLWRHETPAPLCQVTVARMGGEAFVACGGVERTIYLLDADGGVRRTLVDEERPRVIRLLDAGDMDGDGDDEIVFTSHLCEIQVLDGPELERAWYKFIRPYVDGVEQRTGHWRPYRQELADVDEDGRCEVLLGSGFYNANGIRLVDDDGSLIWDKPDGFYFRDGTHYSHTDLVPLDLTDDPGLELVALNAHRLFVFDREGKELASAVSPVSSTDIFPTVNEAGQPELWLGSSPNGEDRVYRVTLAEGWEEAYASLTWEGRTAQVEANLARVREQIEAYQGEAPAEASYLHTITGGQPNTDQLIRAHFAVFDFYRSEFPYECNQFAMTINVLSDQGVPGFTRPDQRMAGRTLPPDQIAPLLASTCEAEHIPFIAVVGHGCEPQITVETAEEILRACPNTCLAFFCSENSRVDDQLAHYLDEYWYPLMDVCARYGAKAFMIEKGAFWVTIPAMERFRKLVDGTYADVLVPSVEDSNSRSPELNLSGRAALYMAGAVNQFSARTIADELCWNRYWEWEFPMVGHMFLRRQLAATALGADIFEYHHYTRERSDDWVTEDNPAGWGLTNIGMDVQWVIMQMLGKGLLVPPAPEDILGMSPCLIGMREPNEAFLGESVNFHQHREWVWDEEEASSPFEGIACHWGMAPVRESYLGSYLMGQDRHYGNFVPATPYGFPLIVPLFLAERGVLAADCVWDTDGRLFYRDGQAQSGLQARDDVLADFRKAAEQMPFQAEGQVFMQAQRMDDDTARLILIDPGFLDPADREVTLHVRGYSALRDLLSGESVGMENGQARLTVPAGAFVLLEAKR